LHPLFIKRWQKPPFKWFKCQVLKARPKEPESLHRNICGFEPVFWDAFIKVINKTTEEEGSQNSQRLSY
jgi:hypothetical protein